MIDLESLAQLRKELRERMVEDRKLLEDLRAEVKLLAASLVRASVSPAEAPTWKMHVQCGSARLVIEEVVKKADTDLLVLGTHGYSGGRSRSPRHGRWRRAA